MTSFDSESERDEALRVLAPMREGPLAVAGRVQDEDALRARVLDSLRAQVTEVPATLHARTRRRFAIGVLAGSTVLAAAAAATLAFVAQQSPSIATHNPPSPAPAALSVESIDMIAGAEHSEADWVDALGQSHALATSALPTGTLELRANGTAPRLRTSQGVQLKLSPEARLRVRSSNSGEGPELRLLAGAVACAVPKLGATRQFAIDAPGARVIVHGTRFSVNATRGKTCVRVTEGLVAVHPEADDAPVMRLGPGEQWGCEREAKVLSPAATPRAATKPRARPARAIDAAPEAEPAGTLDAENRLLAEALSAERKNDRARARRLFAELLRSHPSSPLAVEAAAGLERTRD